MGGVFEHSRIAQQQYVGGGGIDDIFIGDAFGFAAIVPVAETYRVAVSFGDGAELIAGARVAEGGVEHHGVARVYVVGAVVDDFLVGIGVVEVAIAAYRVAGIEVGKVDAVVASCAELEPGGVDAFDGVVGDEGIVVCSIDKVVEVYAFCTGGDGVHVPAVGSVPESPMVGGAVVVPSDTASGVGHEVGVDVAYGVEQNGEFKARRREGVAVAVEFNAEVSGCGVDFDVFVIAAPAAKVPFPGAFVVDGELVVFADVGLATKYDGCAGVGVDMDSLVAVVMVVFGAAGVLDNVAVIDVEGAGAILVVGHDDDGGIAGCDEALLDGSVATRDALVAPKVADVLAVGDEVVELIAAGGGGDGVEVVLGFAIGYPPA